MKHKASIWLLAAAALVILGLGLLAWSVHEDATALGGALVTNTYEIKETYTGIRACTSADIRLEPTDGQDTTVICQEEQDRLHTVRVEDGVLTILEQEPRHDRRLVQLQFKTPVVTICLPRGDYDALSIEGDVGDVNVPQGLRFETAAITASTGDVDFSASVQQTLAVHLSTGEIRLDGIGAGVMDELASRECLSKSRLSHLFTQEMGISLHRYLAFCKMAKASASIAGGASLTDAAIRAGFDSSSHLSATMRRMFGISLTDVMRSMAGPELSS